MSTIPSVPSAVAPSTPVAPPNTVVATDVSDLLRALPPGTRIEVTTLADLVRGQVQASSDYGSLTLRGGLPVLPANSSLSLMLIGTPGDGVAFRLLAVNGLPVAGGAGSPATAPLPGTLPPAGGIPGAIPSLPGALQPGGLLPGGGLFGTAAGDPLAVFGPRAPGSLLQAADQGDAVALSLGKPLAATVIPGPASLLTAGPLAAGALPGGPASPAGTGAGTATAPLPGVPADNPASPGTVPGAGNAPPAGGFAGALTPHGLLAALRHAAHAVAEAAAETAGPHSPAPAPAGPLLPAGSQAQIRLTSVLLPGGSQALTAPSASATPPLASLDGTVTAAPGGGTAVIQTPQGMLLVDVRSPLPVNSQVHLDVLAVTPPTAASAGPTMPASGGMQTFAALSEAQDLLAQNDAEAAQALTRAIPAADGRMVTTMMAVATAARSTDPKSWLGERPVKALDRPEGRGRAVLKDLEESTRETTRPARDGGGDWRMMNLPFSFGGQIDRITLVTRRTGSAAVDEDGSGGGGGQGGGVRFLFALDLSQMGPMQFDGLYKGGPAGQPGHRRLSLLIRTSRPLEPDVRRTILGLFSQSSEAMGLTGSLSFQVSAAFPGPAEALPPSLRATGGAAGGAGGFTA